MATKRCVGSYSVIGIRPAIDGLLIVLCLILGLCLFVGCNSDTGDIDPKPATSSASDTPTEELIPDAAGSVETPTEEITDPITKAPTEVPTEPETRWEVDTGIFNEGKVTYMKQEDGGITATPAEGNHLGLDITNKTDLVSICYSIWFDAILGKSGGTVDNWYNVSEALAGTQNWGPSPQFHYWAKPALGYYSSSNTEVIRTHMTQLYTAGVDFIILDLTNAHDGYLGTSDWTNFIQKPMDALLGTIMEMRTEGLGTPYVVLWVGDWVGESKGPLYQKLYDEYYAQDQWEDCFVYWDGKPLLLTAYTQPEDFPLKDKDLFTVRSMWNYLSKSRPEGQWSYMARSNYKQYAVGPDGSPEQMNIATAAFRHYMTWADTADGRQGGLFWHAQWLSAFEIRPKIITLSWWNEWTAQRLRLDNGEYVFVDNYNQEYSRDIEPMEGGHGDQYYKWMIEYISAYKNHEKCPVLVEKGYEDQVAEFVEDFNHNSLIKAIFDLAEKGGCPGKLILMNCAACGETKEVYDFEISCPVDLNDQSNVQVYTDDDGLMHYLQKVTCPECGIRLEIDLWEDTG